MTKSDIKEDSSKYKAGETVYYMNDDRVNELTVIGPDEGMGEGWYELQDKEYACKFSGHSDDLFRTPKEAIEHEIELYREHVYATSKPLLDKWYKEHPLVFGPKQ